MFCFLGLGFVNREQGSHSLKTFTKLDVLQITTELCSLVQ